MSDETDRPSPPSDDAGPKESRRKPTSPVWPDEAPFGAGLLPNGPSPKKEATRPPVEPGAEGATPADLPSDEPSRPAAAEGPGLESGGGEDLANAGGDATAGSAREGAEASAQVPDSAKGQPQERPSPPPVVDVWDPGATSRDLAIELKRIEGRIRRLLEGVDIRGKRNLEGTRRWLELQDDLIAMRFTGAVDEATIQELLALCARRHQVFHRLNFMVATRPTWNT